MEQLAGVDRLGNPVVHAEPGHRLVGDLRVEPDHVGLVEGGDERQGVADGRQERVATGLVGLGFEGEAGRVAAIADVAAQEVERLPIPRQGGEWRFGGNSFDSLAAAPEDVRLGAELGSEVDRPHRLLECVTPDVSIAGRERPVLERRMPEQVRRGHRHDHAGRVEGLAEPIEDDVALGERRFGWDEIVVVEADAPSAEIAEAVHELPRLDRRAHGIAEGIPPTVPDGPESERELVLGSGVQRVHRPLLIGWC